ncbi:MAG: D-alanyl-D-alanine carboxypeptidase [Ruminococcaceae bacterium]|nr:D-alanyl-D-alanine carboxypeptidase [Oscillospiraceae bacterium]
MNNKKIHIDGKMKQMATVILVTFCAFLIAVVTMSVCLIVNAVQDNRGGSVMAGGGGGGGGISQGSGNTDTPTPSVPSTKTQISLPSATFQKNYLATAGADYKDISSDTEIKSQAIVLVDITDNKVIAGKNVDAKIYPASMTKVMTLLVACENATDPKALLTVTPEMVEKYGNSEGASIAFPWQEGYQVTVEDALHLVIYESDTYACWLLAEHVAGNEAAFVQKMNEKASALGCTSTNFKNATGLFHSDHYTTCREMAAIMAAAMNNEAAAAVLTSKDYYTVDIYVDGQKAEEKGMWSGWYTGRLEEYRLSGVAPKYVGGGSDVMITAGKTGYEDIPTNCFVTAAENDTTGRKYVCVQVGRTDSSQDTVNTKTSTDDTRNIYRKYAKDE